MKPWLVGTMIVSRLLTPMVGALGQTALPSSSPVAPEPAAGSIDVNLPDAQPVAFVVDSPVDWQVFQRKTRLAGAIRVSGVTQPNSKVQVRLAGKSLTGLVSGVWQAVPVDSMAHTYFAELATPAGGWYTLDIQSTVKGEPPVIQTIPHVGVGEVFVGAGQSNSTNYGEVRTQPTSGMVTTFSGSEWRIADDPQPGAHDRNNPKAQFGSLWPAFGDAMYAHYGVPIGVAVTGNGGTSLDLWNPDGDIFNWTLTRIQHLGPFGFRALLWHQGESDYNTAADDYAAKLAHIIQTARLRAGWAFPWIVAHASYENPTLTGSAKTGAGQEAIWKLGIALPGPDTDKLVGDLRLNSGPHFTAAGLKAHGELWAVAVEAYLDPLLAKEPAK